MFVPIFRHIYDTLLAFAGPTRHEENLTQWCQVVLQNGEVADTLGTRPTATALFARRSLRDASSAYNTQILLSQVKFWGGLPQIAVPFPYADPELAIRPSAHLVCL